MKHYLLSYSKKRQYFLCCGDLLILLVAILVSYSIRMFINDQDVTAEQLISKFSPWLILVVLPHLLGLYLLDLYNLNRLIYRFRSSLMVLLSVGFAGLVIGAIFFFMPKYVFGRQVLLIHLGVSSLLLVSWRIIFHEFLSSGEKTKRLAFVGSGAVLSDFADKISKIDGLGFVIHCAYLFAENRAGDETDVAGIEYYDSVDNLLEQGEFELLVFDVLSTRLTFEEITKIMQVKFNNKAVFDLPTFYKNITGKIPLNYIDGSWILNQQSMQGQIGKPYIHCKRLMDIFGSLLLLVIFSPLFLLIALAVKIESKGAAIFIQERLGLHRHPFNCLKFRTMVDDAEQSIGPTWSSEDDPRVTKLGKFLRKTRLDELPQLVNILLGDISFVGPRPIREHFASQLSEQIPYYDLRYSVQPGLSGWAQIHKCYAVPDGYQSLEYELFYIQNISLAIDCLIMIKTLKTLFQAEGK